MKRIPNFLTWCLRGIFLILFFLIVQKKIAGAGTFLASILIFVHKKIPGEGFQSLFLLAGLFTLLFIIFFAFAWIAKKRAIDGKIIFRAR